MMRRFVQFFVLLPLAVLLVAFAVANRHWVVISLDPLGAEAPALSVSLPLFVLVFLVLLLGVVIGGVAAWLRQSRWRRLARHERREAERWRERAEEEARRAARPAAPALSGLPRTEP